MSARLAGVAPADLSPGPARSVVAFVADHGRLAVTSALALEEEALAWPVSRVTRVETRRVVRVVRFDLAREEGGPPGVALAVVERTDGSVVVLTPATRTTIGRSALATLESGDPSGLDDLRDVAPHLDLVRSHEVASNSEVADLTRRVHALARTDLVALSRVVEERRDERPLLSGSPASGVFGDARVARAYLAALREVGDGVPVEWALRHAVATSPR